MSGVLGSSEGSFHSLQGSVMSGSSSPVQAQAPTTAQGTTTFEFCLQRLHLHSASTCDHRKPMKPIELSANQDSNQDLQHQVAYLPGKLIRSLFPAQFLNESVNEKWPLCKSHCVCVQHLDTGRMLMLSVNEQSHLQALCLN